MFYVENGTTQLTTLSNSAHKCGQGFWIIDIFSHSLSTQTLNCEKKKKCELAKLLNCRELTQVSKNAEK